ncbi:MAG: hypothetical protein V1644_02440 [Candidatus Micrarchaeota archaeon]
MERIFKVVDGVHRVNSVAFHEVYEHMPGWKKPNKVFEYKFSLEAPLTNSGRVPSTVTGHVLRALKKEFGPNYREGGFDRNCTITLNPGTRNVSQWGVEVSPETHEVSLRQLYLDHQRGSFEQTKRARAGQVNLKKLVKLIRPIH